MIEKIQIVHKDFRESFESMPIDSVGRLTLALFRYANDEDASEVLAGDQVAKTFFPTLKAHVERQEDYRRSRAENGKKGGGQFGNCNAKKTSENDLKRPKTSKNEQKRTPNPNPNPNPNPVNKRHYGECENVLLTDEEYEKIKNKGLTNLIDELSFYIEGSGKKYKSHYAVIRQWANRREKEKADKKADDPTVAGANAKNRFCRFTQRTDYNFEELEKRLVKN